MIGCLAAIVRLSDGLFRAAGAETYAESDRKRAQMRGYWRLLSWYKVGGWCVWILGVCPGDGYLRSPLSVPIKSTSAPGCLWNIAAGRVLGLFSRSYTKEYTKEFFPLKTGPNSGAGLWLWIAAVYI